MTPQERQRVAELFDRLAGLEGAPRDREAEQAIAEGLRAAPHAVYPLVQTVLVQDEALKRADERIRELEAALGEDGAAPQGGFLENMRDALFGGREQARGSVPSVRPEGAPMGTPPGFRTGAPGTPYGAPQQQSVGQGGSFLGTAAAAAAGAIGGAMMLQGIRGMFGDQRQGAFGAHDSAAGGGATTPWSGDVSGDLARQVRLDDMAGGRASDADANTGKGGFGLLDATDDAAAADDDFDGDFDADFGGDGGGEGD
jgi:hypothetical protein